VYLGLIRLERIRVSSDATSTETFKVMKGM